MNTNLVHELQNELFAQDTFNSMKAAFPFNTFQSLNQKYLKGLGTQLYCTSIFPLFLCLKSKTRNYDFNTNIQLEIEKLIEELPIKIKKELDLANTLFKLKGCHSKYLK